MDFFVVEVGRISRLLYGPFWSEDQAHGFAAGQRGRTVIRKLLPMQDFPSSDPSGPCDSPGAMLMRAHGFKFVGDE